MTVAIADLVAKVRAEGVEQTAAAVKQVSANAQEAARALELMAQSAAKSGGGTPAGWLDMFQRQGVQPTAAALAQARSEMERTVAAASQAVQPAQSVARAAADHASAARTGAQAVQAVSEGWKLSESSIVRFGTALVGINLGISLLAGTARLLHQEIAASVDAAVELDRVSRGLTATYGAGTAGMTSFARTLAPQAGVSLTAAEQALTAAGPLANQFGLTPVQIQELSARAADLAGARGQPFDKTFAAVLQGVQSGGTQLQGFGVRLDDVYVKTIAYNGALSATYDRMTQAQQIGVRFNQFLDQTRNAQGSAATAADTLSGSLDHLGASLDRLRERSGNLATGGIQGPAAAVTSWVDQILGTGATGDRRSIIGDSNAPGGARIISGQPQFDIAGASAALGLNAPVGPPAFTGPVPLRGADLLRAQAANAQDYAGRAVAEAQAQVTALQLQSEERRLNVAEQLASYRTDELRIQEQMAPLMLDQANLQDRITIASRDDLNTRRTLISAQQGALGPQSVASAAQYQQNMAQALAQQRMARLLQGQSVADLPSVDQLIRMNIQGQLAAAENAPALVRAQRGVEVAGQQATAQDLTRQQTLTNLEDQRRKLEDQTIPLQEQLRLTQEREASVQRTLELADLAQTASLTAAQQALNEANTIKLVADETARIAQDYSDHMVIGATALERAFSAMGASQDAVTQANAAILNLTTSQSDRRVQLGLGAGGLGPTVAVHAPITVNGATVQQVKDQVHAEIEHALNQVFGEVQPAAILAPSDLAGARHR